jgi:hypothetical protein
MSTITIPLRPSAAARVLPLAAAGALAVTAVVVLGTPGHSAPALPEPAAVPAVAGPPVVPNAGQSPAAVRFEARAEGGALYFTPRDVVLARRAAVVRLRFDGAAAAPRLTPTGRRAGVVNVLRGPDPARWRTGLSSYAGVRYAGLYPGVDVRHDVAATAAGPWVRSVFTVASGADATAISWRYAGAHRPSVDPVTGALEVAPRAGGPALRSSAPIAWQVVGGRREAVPASFRVDDDGAVGFALGRHDRAHPLLLAAVPPTRKAVNDPQPQLTFSSFFGGTNWDELYDVDVDPAGDAYVTGITNSPNFPLANARQGQFADVIDAVVARVSAAGTLVYSTYLGGDAMDAGHNIAVDKGGNAYVTGRTESEDFPVEAPLQRPINGRRCQGEPCHDAFVTKLDPNGQIAYSTYLGGTGTEEGWGIAVDGDGRAVVTGNTDSDDFPTRNAVQDANRSKGCAGDVPCPFDNFVARLNPSGSALQFGTYLGGRGGELSGGVAVDAQGHAYVSGTTRSPDFPTRNALQPEIKGNECGPPPGFPCTDLYLTKLSEDGSAIDFSTYLGGTQNDRGGGVAVDAKGRSYLTGATQSPDFPTESPVQGEIDNRSCTTEGPLELCDDAFVTGLSPDGQRLKFSTFLGGGAEDQGLGIAVDTAGVIHVVGSTDSRRFRVEKPVQATLAGRIDGFVARYAPGGRSLVFSTFLGGRKDERLNGIAVAKDGTSVVAGRTTSPEFPTAGPFQAALAGDIDGVVARLR